MSKSFYIPGNGMVHYALLFVRIIMAWRLIGGTWPFIFGGKDVGVIVSYFTSLGIPLAGMGAYLSVYTQMACGILLLLGLFTRVAAAALAFNFLVAVLAAHTKDKIEDSFAAWILLANSVLFMFAGGGRLALDRMFRE